MTGGSARESCGPSATGERLACQIVAASLVPGQPPVPHAMGARARAPATNLCWHQRGWLTGVTRNPGPRHSWPHPAYLSCQDDFVSELKTSHGNW
jgi:hypothetical protein